MALAPIPRSKGPKPPSASQGQLDVAAISVFPRDDHSDACSEVLWQAARRVRGVDHLCRLLLMTQHLNQVGLSVVVKMYFGLVDEEDRRDLASLLGRKGHERNEGPQSIAPLRYVLKATPARAHEDP